MKLVGAKKLQKQIEAIPDEMQKAIDDSMLRTVKYGARKAKSVVPVDTGELREGINWQFYKDSRGAFGFINFHDNTKDDAIKVGAVNYGRKTGETVGYGFIEYVRTIVAPRHQRAVKRNIKKALQAAVK